MSKIVNQFKLLFHKIKDDDIMPWSSMLTIYLLLSLFPIIIIITEIISRASFNDPLVISYWVDLFPKPIYESFQAISVDIVKNDNATIIPIAIIITFWSSSRGILAIIKALNKAYEVKETRNYFQLRFLAVLYTLGLIFLIVISLALIVFGNNLYTLAMDVINLPLALEGLFSILRFVLTILFAFMFFMALYNLPPTVKVGFWKVLPGSIFASVGLIGISYAFSLYVQFFSNLSYLYGSLTGFIIIILWLFIVSVMIMVGGEINAVFSSHRFNHNMTSSEKS